MAYLSVPSPGKCISDMFGKHSSDNVLTSDLPTFFEKMSLRWLLWPKCQVRFSLKSEFFTGNFHQRFVFLVKPIFCFYNTENQFNKKLRCSDLFLSLVPPVLPFVFEKK